MKQVLVTIPLSVEERKKLESYDPDGICLFKYMDRKDITPEDMKHTSILLGTCIRSLLPGATSLEWLQLPHAGAEEYVREGVLPAGVILTNASGAYGQAVSEHMAAFTLSLLHRFPEYMRNQQLHDWHIIGSVHSIRRSTVLVLGVGDIGGNYARQMKALGAHTIGVRRTEKEKPIWLDEQYTLDALDELLPRADVVAMVLPGGEHTVKVMDEHRIGLMKKGAVLLNAGRGSSLDLNALKAALKEGRLAGAALDVTDPEPLPEDDELWDMPNVQITPHSSGNYLLEGTYDLVLQIIFDNFDRYMKGLPLNHIVDKKAGY